MYNVGNAEININLYLYVPIVWRSTIARLRRIVLPVMIMSLIKTGRLFVTWLIRLNLTYPLWFVEFPSAAMSSRGSFWE